MDGPAAGQTTLTLDDDQTAGLCGSLQEVDGEHQLTLTAAQPSDWTHLTQAPIQVVRILNANGEELQMLSATEYHDMDGQHVTLVSDQSVSHFGPMDGSGMAARLTVQHDQEHHTLVEAAEGATVSLQAAPPSQQLTIIGIPFLTASNQHDPEVQYFAEIYRCLLTGLSQDGCQTASKSLRRQLKEYSIQEGQLYYGITKLRQVLLDKNRQRQVLIDTHISPETGVHYGIRRMSADIRYYWRGVYNDVARTVRECDVCFESQKLQRSPISPPSSCVDTDNAVHIHLRTPSSSLIGGASLAIEGALVPVRTKAQLQMERSARVWKKVEAHILGPFVRTEVGHEYVVCVVDGVSRWLEARPAAADRRYQALIDLVLHVFCQRGVAQCAFVDIAEQQFMSMQTRCKERLSRMQDTVQELVLPRLDNCFVFTLQDGASRHTAWAVEMMDRYTGEYGDQWDVELDMFLFSHHLCVQPDTGYSPFYFMYGRNANGSVDEEEQENCTILEEEKALDVPAKPRRRLQSSILQCRHCDEVYTSKISFRIHQRKHTEQARRCGVVEGQQQLTRAAVAIDKKLLRRAIRIGRRGRSKPGVSASLCQPRPGWTQERLTDPPPVRDHVTTSAITNVQALVEATRGVRQRRGKYIKYTDALRDEIAAYALEHGFQQACQFYTPCLGRPVSLTSVRNFVRSSQVLTPEKRVEIGKYGLRHGPQEAAEFYTDKLQIELKPGVVRRYMKECRLKAAAPIIEGADNAASQESQMAPPPSDLHSMPADGSFVTTPDLASVQSPAVLNVPPPSYLYTTLSTSGQSQTAHFAPLLVNSSGGAQQYQDPTVIYTSQYPVVTQQQQYVTAAVGAELQVASTQQQQYVTAAGAVTADDLMQHDDLAAAVVADPTTLLVVQQTHQHVVPSDADHYLHDPSQQQDALGLATTEADISPRLSSPPDLHPDDHRNLSSSDHHVLPPMDAHVMHEHTETHLMSSVHEVDNRHDHLTSCGLPASDEFQSVDPAVPSSVASGVAEDALEDDEDDPDEEDPEERFAAASRLSGKGGFGSRVGRGSTTTLKNGGVQRLRQRPPRGLYTSYSPELRAEVGKYAYEHGNLEARRHFHDRLGCSLPESTIRGLKEKYAVKLRRGVEVTSLGFAPRGRPIRLGKYEVLVQDCIRKLAATGQKISSFICIETAKQVLMQYEPNLLEERGGPIKLNVSWAKSFIRRLGLAGGGALHQGVNQHI